MRTCKSDGALGEDPALLEVPRRAAQEWGPSLTDVVVTWYALRRFKLPLKLGTPLITIYHPESVFLSVGFMDRSEKFSVQPTRVTDLPELWPKAVST